MTPRRRSRSGCGTITTRPTPSWRSSGARSTSTPWTRGPRRRSSSSRSGSAWACRRTSRETGDPKVGEIVVFGGTAYPAPAAGICAGRGVRCAASQALSSDQHNRTSTPGRGSSTSTKMPLDLHGRGFRQAQRRQGFDAGRRIGESFEDASSPADGIQPPRGGPPVISGLVPAGGEVGGAEAEREFHQPGPVVHAGFEVGGRGGHAERGQPVVQAGDGAQADG